MICLKFRTLFMAAIVGTSVVTGANAASLSEARLGTDIHGTFEGQLYGEDLTIKVMPSGKLVGRYGDDKDTGVWKIFDNGMLCLKWNNWLNSARRCGVVKAEDGKYRIMGISLTRNN